jgi:hypothetical protein
VSVVELALRRRVSVEDRFDQFPIKHLRKALDAVFPLTHSFGRHGLEKGNNGRGFEARERRHRRVSLNPPGP